MRRVLIPLCLAWVSLIVYGQRPYQYESPERLFTEGKELFELKNYAGCIDKLEAYQQRSKEVGLMQETGYMLARSTYEQGLPGAGSLLRDYLQQFPDSPHNDEICFLIGSVCFGQENYREAIAWFGKSDIDLLTDVQQEECSFRLAYSLLQTGQMDNARNYFNRIRQAGTVYRNASGYYAAYIDYATGKYNEALAAFARLSEVSAYREQALYYITQIYFVQNRYDRVTDNGRRLLSAYPNSENNTELYRIMGNAYYQTGNPEAALEYLNKYVAATDEPLRGDLYILGVCRYNQGDYQGAISALQPVVDNDDALTQSACLYLGQSFLKQNDKNNARMAFEAAATASFDGQVRETAMYNYGLLVHETGFTGFGESVTVFEDFLNDFPQSRYSDRVNDYLAEVYLTTKDYRSALTSINKIKNPGTRILEAKQDILFQLGTQAFANVRLDEAIALFDQAISLGSYNTNARNDAYFWRGESYYRLNNYTKAVSDFVTYLNNSRQRNADTYTLARYNLGYSYFKQKNYREAQASFLRYIESESNRQAPAYADAHNRMGDCFFYDRRYAQAEEYYSRSAQLQPQTGDYAVYQTGYMLGLKKDYQGKINAMDRLIRTYPQSRYLTDALFEKGRSYVLLENNRAAAETFELLMRRFPQSSLARKAGVQLGLTYYNENQPQKAADTYKKVIAHYPGSEEAKVAFEDLKSVYLDMNDVSGFAAYAHSLGETVRFESSEQDSLTYLAAEKQFLRGDNNGARRSLINYLQSFPTGAFSANANFYLGSIAFTNKEYEDARSLFVAVLESGDTKFREEALVKKAGIEYQNGSYAQALESYQSLAAVAENPEHIEAARIGTMRSAQLAGRMQEALQAADDLLKDPKLLPELAIEARYIRAKAYMESKQTNRAVIDLKVIGQDTRTTYGAEAKYLLAQIYFDNNEDLNAEKVLEEFAHNGTPHQYWLARGFILWADIYIRKGDHAQARVYLNSLQSNYKGDDSIAQMIQTRLEKLKK